MIEINLFYFKHNSNYGNFGDELSKYITENLIDKKKYKLVYNQPNKDLNIICIGSYIHRAVNDCYIYGSGIRTISNQNNKIKHENLNVCAVRGYFTRKVLLEKNKEVPEIYGDPALLLPLFYKPTVNPQWKEKIGLVPHKSNYGKYKNNIDKEVFLLIDPTDKWENVIDAIVSCKSVVSSSLHGLICSDAYNIPNLWIDEFELKEGDFKFKDYFSSQNRPYTKIKSLEEYDSTLLYNDGNKVDLEKLVKAFPFS